MPGPKTGRGRVEKGKRLEREVVRRARATGLRAERGTLGTRQETGAAADTLIWVRGVPIRVECRNRTGFGIVQAQAVLRAGHYQAVVWPERMGRQRLLMVAHRSASRSPAARGAAFWSIVRLVGWRFAVCVCDLDAWFSIVRSAPASRRGSEVPA